MHQEEATQYIPKEGGKGIPLFLVKQTSIPVTLGIRSLYVITTKDIRIITIAIVILV